MPRRLRKDYPGAWHHVTSRGIAKRAIFETNRDVRYLLAGLARQVRAGDLEVHTYTVLATHFHLLVRSPRGRLSIAMQRALDAFARWFNRGRRRDGPLFRGRFANRVIEDDSYLEEVVRYIDHNPVRAGMAPRPEEYPHGSARYYIGGGGPPWLRKDCILREIHAESGGIRAAAAAYRQAYGEGLDLGRNAWVVERNLRLPPGRRLDPAALGARSTASWMRWKARIADGPGGEPLVLHPDSVRDALETARRRISGLRIDSGRKSCDPWEVLECAALREFSGLKQMEVAKRLGWAVTKVRRRLTVHEKTLQTGGPYLRAFEAIAKDANRSIPNPTRNRRIRSPRAASPLAHVPEGTSGPKPT